MSKGSFDDEHDTIITLRIPISLAKKVEDMDWGLARKKQKRRSEIYRSAIEKGAQFQNLRIIMRDPKKAKEIQEKFFEILKTNNQEQVLETMKIEEIESLILLASMIKEKKFSQLSIMVGNKDVD